MTRGKIGDRLQICINILLTADDDDVDDSYGAV